MSNETPRKVLTPACDPALWQLDPTITYLNHGAFGACPLEVLAYQREIRDQMERDPIDFFVRKLEVLLDSAREKLANFIGAPADDLVFVPNATAGINSVLRSLRFEPGDEFLVGNHEYNASRNALDYAAERAGVRVAVADIPFPLGSAQDVTAAYLDKLSPRTRLVLLDHVTSQTGLVFPLAEIVAELSSRGIETLVDGAHAPGMIPLNLREIGATYYTGNCHKWLCAPKGAGFLYVRSDRQHEIRPLIISHGANSPRKDRSRFQIEFGWTGTGDVSAYLSVPEALRFIGARLPGGWPAVMDHNHRLVLHGREILCQALQIAEPCPAEMIGSLATLPLPDADREPPFKSPLYLDPLQEQLFEEHRIEVPIIPWPKSPKRQLRISAQVYNHPGQYLRLAEALLAALRQPDNFL